jgi:hypothetical protein
MTETLDEASNFSFKSSILKSSFRSEVSIFEQMYLKSTAESAVLFRDRERPITVPSPSRPKAF